MNTTKRFVWTLPRNWWELPAIRPTRGTFTAWPTPSAVEAGWSFSAALMPRFCPKKPKNHADAVVIGEAERTWPAVIEDAAQDALQPYYRDVGPPSLEGLPHARRDLICRRGLCGDTIIATRGCPHRCTYCNLRQIYDGTPRFRPVEEVVREIRTLRSPLLTFWDDQLLMEPGYAFHLFERLASSGKRWAAMVTLASASTIGCLLPPHGQGASACFSAWSRSRRKACGWRIRHSISLNAMQRESSGFIATASRSRRESFSALMETTKQPSRRPFGRPRGWASTGLR